MCAHLRQSEKNIQKIMNSHICVTDVFFECYLDNKFQIGKMSICILAICISNSPEENNVKLLSSWKEKNNFRPSE